MYPKGKKSPKAISSRLRRRDAKRTKKTYPTDASKHAGGTVASTTLNKAKKATKRKDLAANMAASRLI